MSAHQQPLTPRIGVASVCSPLEVGAATAPQAVQAFASVLRTAGCEVVDLGVIDHPQAATAAGRTLAAAGTHATALVAASWFEDFLVFDLLEECAAPLLLWSLPGMETGALCGMQQLTAGLQQLAVPFQAVYGPLAAGDDLRNAQTFLEAAALKHRLRRARVGLAGYPAHGMHDIACNPLELKRVLGPRVVPLDMPQLLATAAQIADNQALPLWHTVAGRAAACDVSQAAGLDAVKTALALRQLIEHEGLNALAFGCYPHWMGRACLAASLMADEGIPLACEGDVHGAVGQLLLALLTNQPTHNTDWLDPLDDKTVVMTHCGSGSFSLAETPESVRLAPVRLANHGACVLFPARPGPVTLLNILARGPQYQVAVLEGEAESTVMVFPGNPLRVGFGCPIGEVMTWIHDEGIGHHWMAGYGHVAAGVRQWVKLLGEDVRLVCR